jgi:hypothetical protein
MSADYIPKSQTSLAIWARNFSEKISATPGAFGLMASDAAAIAQAVGLFDDALTLALQPSTKTKSIVADKDGKRAAMLVTLRTYAQMIKRNQGISDEAKINLGLHIDAPGPSTVPAPSSAPRLILDNDGYLVQRLRFRDEANPDRMAKPPGVIGMLLAVVTVPFDAIHGPAAMLPSYETAPVHGLVTRQPYRIQFPASALGRIACYFARWVTRDGTPGPWSSMRQLMIAG